MVFAIPAALQLAQISIVNKPTQMEMFRYLRHLKIFAVIGGVGALLNEKASLESKWRYYDRFYPEPTQLQRTLIKEAQIYKDREALGFAEQTIDDKLDLDPET